jgi:biopolymer transport protein TolR
MASDVGPSNGKFGNMNVTPLIDVLLTLLVIFMVITPVTPMGETAQIPQPPKQHTPQPQNNRSVVLQVLAGPGGESQIKINQESSSMQDLENRLVDIYKTRAQKVLFIKADDSVPWADVATVIDDAHGAGVEHVGLITSKVEASQNRSGSHNAG